jgi:hypothetical protein
MSPAGRVEPDGGKVAPGTALAKVAAVAAFFALWTVCYKLTNEWGAVPGRAIHLTRPCDVWPGIIQPWTAVIYLFGGFLMPFLPFAYNRTWDRLGFVLTTYGMASSISFVAYALVPLSITRPPFPPTGVGNRLMRCGLSVDNEVNCLPSFHVVFAVLGALLVAHGGASRGMRFATWALAVAVCLTTITTGQHYLVDVPGGVATAVASYALARRVCKASVVSARAPTAHRPPGHPDHGQR